MASTPLKIRRKTSVLWEHATKVFHENGSVKYIKCIHCGKTSYGGSTSNALKHLKSMHFNHLNPFMDSKNRSPHTYELKCEMKQKLEDGIETAKTQKDYDDDAGPLSKWSNSSDKIIGEVNGEIRPVPEDYIDEAWTRIMTLTLIQKINQINQKMNHHNMK